MSTLFTLRNAFVAAVVVLLALRAHTYDVLQTPPVVIYTTANALALFLGLLVAVAAAVVTSVPDIARYLRLRQM